MQFKLAAAIFFAFVVGAAFTAFVVGTQAQASNQSLNGQGLSAGHQNGWQSGMGRVTAELEARQQMLDKVVEGYFGKDQIAAVQATTPGAVASQAAPLARLQQQQIAFVETLTAAARLRTHEAETALRAYGLNPRKVARGALQPAMGGPFIAVQDGDEHLARLSQSLERLDRMERTLLAIPNGAPTTPMRLTSTFGHRSDPFNGRRAVHGGMDIAGPTGQRIMASAAGRVSFAGRASGYGNLIKIDHGHGIETRYGHLSKINVRAGQSIARGEDIGRMGSTGRSTGPHLHFEVRLDGRALDPRQFLEAKPEVIAVQNSAKARRPALTRG